jgi:hypothetical protein
VPPTKSASAFAKGNAVIVLSWTLVIYYVTDLVQHDLNAAHVIYVTDVIEFLNAAHKHYSGNYIL